METPSREDIESTCLSHQQGGIAHESLPDVAQPHMPGRYGEVEICILVKRTHSTSRPNDWLR